MSVEGKFCDSLYEEEVVRNQHVRIYTLFPLHHPHQDFVKRDHQMMLVYPDTKALILSNNKYYIAVYYSVLGAMVFE